MIKTKKYIEELRKNLIRINDKQEKAIIEYWGEYIGNEFTEQDIWEQTRKILNKYVKY